MDGLNNFKLVANIPILGKLIERLVADQLQVSLEETNYQDLFQSGFRLCHGTETARIVLHYDLLRETNRRSTTLLILLDLSDFDTIDLNIFLDRLSGLSELGIRDLTLLWFWSFLDGHGQMIQFGDAVLTL